MADHLPLWFRLGRLLVIEAQPSIKDAVLGVLVFVFATTLKVQKGDLSWDLTWQNFGEALFPIVAALMVFLTMHTLKAAHHLIKELKAEEGIEEYNPYPSLVLSEQITATRKKGVPFFRLKITLFASLFIFVFVGISFAAWELSAIVRFLKRPEDVSLSTSSAPTATTTATASPAATATPSPTPSAQPTVTPAKSRRAMRRRRADAEERERREILRALETQSPQYAHAPQSKAKAKAKARAITKTGIKQALSKIRTKNGLRILEEQIRKRGISFRFTQDAETELRTFAAEHGNISIDGLIDLLSGLEAERVASMQPPRTSNTRPAQFPFREKPQEDLRFILGSNVIQMPRSMLREGPQPIPLQPLIGHPSFNSISIYMKDYKPFVDVRMLGNGDPYGASIRRCGNLKTAYPCW